MMKCIIWSVAILGILIGVTVLALQDNEGGMYGDQDSVGFPSTIDIGNGF